jgi:riboflavin kinase/FMN adenylyltransferase
MTFTRVNHLSEVIEKEPTFVAVGSFDGVHLGHQQVLKRMVAAADNSGARSAVLTFFPHPKRLLLDIRGRYYLSTLPERVTLLAELGVDLIITQPFDEELRQTRAADFIEQLCHYLDMRQLWGGNFGFGYRKEGDITLLRHLGQEKGYTVQLVNAMVEWGGELVSSSRVRRSLENGNVADVAGCLGRPYRVSGTVVRGDQRGRTIGFPTANLSEWDEQLLPANGVYGGYAWVGTQRYLAATNVGVRPTVNGSNVQVESHLLDFDGDLYGRHIQVDFVRRIRAEKKFSGLEALQDQIRADVSEVRKRLSLPA